MQDAAIGQSIAGPVSRRTRRRYHVLADRRRYCRGRSDKGATAAEGAAAARGQGAAGGLYLQAAARRGYGCRRAAS